MGTVVINLQIIYRIGCLKFWSLIVRECKQVTIWDPVPIQLFSKFIFRFEYDNTSWEWIQHQNQPKVCCCFVIYAWYSVVEMLENDIAIVAIGCWIGLVSWLYHLSSIMGVSIKNRMFYHTDTCIFFDYAGVSLRLTTQPTDEIILFINKQIGRGIFSANHYILSCFSHDTIMMGQKMTMI